MEETQPKLRVQSTCQPNGKLVKHPDNRMDKPVLLGMNSPEVLKMMLDRVEKPKKRRKQGIVIEINRLKKAK